MKTYSARIIALMAWSILTFLTNSAFSATYYVNSTCSDGGNGTSSNCDGGADDAWNEIADINAFNFANDDIIQLKRSDTFDDKTLTLDGTSAGRTGITIQAYGSGDKPRIDGNSVKPIRINHELVNLTIKDIDISGSDTSGARATFENINGLTIDGLDYNGHTGSSRYVRSDCILIKYVTGDIEIKNCTIQNLMKDTFANSLSVWGSLDAVGIIFWYPGNDNVKISGSVSIHDNTIHDVYSDCIHIAGIHTTTNIYANTLINFAENAIDLKYSRYVTIYQNEMSQNDYGFNGSGYWGPSAICSGDPGKFWEDTTYKARDNVIKYNYIHTSPWLGMSTAGEDCQIYNNYFKDVGAGISIEHNGAKVFNNIFNMTTGIPAANSDPSDADDHWQGSHTQWTSIKVEDILKKSSGYIYNNTIYMTSSNHRYGIVYKHTGNSGFEIKNNLIHMTRNSSSVFPLYTDTKSGDDPTVTNNLYYNANHSNRVNWKGTVYDNTEQVAWISAGHTRAVFGYPAMDNPSNSNFTLQIGSPCIDVGVNLGATYDKSWNPSSMPPNTISTLDRDGYGSGWDIGAFEYQEENQSVGSPDNLKITSQ